MERTYTKKEVIKKQVWTFVFGLMAGVFLMGGIASEKAKKEKEKDAVLWDRIPRTKLFVTKPTGRQKEFNIVIPALLLMEIYWEETANDSIETYDEKTGKLTWEPRPRTLEDMYHWSNEYFREQF
nr:hypothetical protein [uncultured Allomuricauda sp.]